MKRGWIPIVFALSMSAGVCAAAKPPPGYSENIVDEVDLQNLPCAELEQLLHKPLQFTMEQVVEDFLNQPQYQKETSVSLLGPTFNAKLLQASGVSPPCVKVVTQFLKEHLYRGDPTICGGPGTRGAGAIADRSMNALNAAPDIHPGELYLMSQLDNAAKLKNCRR